MNSRCEFRQNVHEKMFELFAHDNQTCVAQKRRIITKNGHYLDIFSQS